MDVLVIGAGVIGLTTAISLAEAGLKVTVRAAGTGAQTTSFASGALWGPVRCGPPDAALEWSRTGLEVMTALADDPSSGISMVSGREVSAEPARPPRWLSLLPGGTHPAELPPGFVSGWRYTAPLATMPVYLRYLRDRFRRAGGVTEYGRLRSLAELTEPLVVNCTGTGARELVPDPGLLPIRGQVVIVTNPGGVEEFYIDHNESSPDYVYYFPHKDVVLLGGTAEEGAWDLSVNHHTTSRIVADCQRACPSLRGARIVGLRVGLRPYRERVRLEREELPGGRVLWHNYGHGGGGVTLAWGCAREITESVLSSRPAGQPGRRD